MNRVRLALEPTQEEEEEEERSRGELVSRGMVEEKSDYEKGCSGTGRVKLIGFFL